MAKISMKKLGNKLPKSTSWNGVGKNLSSAGNAFGTNFKSAFGDKPVQSLIKSGAGGVVGGAVIGAGVETVRGGDAWDGAKKGAMVGGTYSMGRSALMGGFTGNPKGVSAAVNPMSRVAARTGSNAKQGGNLASSYKQFASQNPSLSKAVKSSMTLAKDTNVSKVFRSKK